MFLLVAEVMQIHDPGKGIPMADIVPSDSNKTKGGYLIDKKTKCTAHFENFKHILHNNKYVACDLIDLSKRTVVRDFACSPGAYAGRKSSNSKGNRTKEELHALGGQTRDAIYGEVKDTTSKVSKVPRTRARRKQSRP